MPIIISAPHAQSKIHDRKIRNRIALCDYEIWKCSDPLTDRLKEFSCAKYIQKAKTHRLVCDLNRPPNELAFHNHDFFGRPVFKKGKKFSKKEKSLILKEYWLPYHEKLEKKIQEIDSKTKNPLLVIEYHNTSGDHPLNQQHEYMPGFVLSNLGEPITGRKTKKYPHISAPAKLLKFLQKEITKTMNVRVEINEIYEGGYNTSWLSKLDTKNPLYTIQIEYNLDFVANPISKHTDLKALHLMQTALNKALIKLYRTLSK